VQYYAFDDSCQALVGNFINQATGELTPARCKKWSCKFCGPRAARRFVARVMRAKCYTYAITLTARPHGAMTRELVKSFNASWRSWKQWLERETGGRLGDCSWTLEQGPANGHLHRHALIATRRSFSYKRARAALVRCGLGAVCDFKPIRSQKSGAVGGRYLGKYLAKATSEHQSQWPRYSRRAQTSVPDVRPPGDPYIFVPRPSRVWRRFPERDIPLIRENWLPGDMRWSQVPLALNQKEKVRHEILDFPSNRGP
jgi:hypothetical protein